MFAALVDLTITMEHYRPLRTPRPGIVPSLYNRVLVPVAEALPAPVLRPFGFHAVIRGRKPG